MSGHNPYFSSVKEVEVQAGSVAIIVPDPSSGKRNRYHTYRLDLKTSCFYIVGRELDLKHSRAVARRKQACDSLPLCKEEISVGCLSPSKWKARKGRLL